jgi:hypothetical protein
MRASTGRSSKRSSPQDVALLERAAELVESGWCQNALARDRDGRQVEPWGETARSWSPLGALLGAWYQSGGADRDAFDAAYASLALATGGRVEEWNDARWRTRRHVLGAFTRARAYLRIMRRQAASTGRERTSGPASANRAL